MKMEQEHHSCIESWFEVAIKPHHSFLHYFLVSYHLQLLVFHALVHIKYFKSKEECICTPIIHMVALQVLLHLKEDIIFFN